MPSIRAALPWEIAGQMEMAMNINIRRNVCELLFMFLCIQVTGFHAGT